MLQDKCLIDKKVDVDTSIIVINQLNKAKSLAEQI